MGESLPFGAVNNSLLTDNNPLSGRNVTDGNYAWQQPSWFVYLIISITGVAIVLNVIHLVFVTQMPAGRRTGARNFRLFILTLACSDLAVCCIRFITSQHIVQRFMAQHHKFCVVTASLGHPLQLYVAHVILLAAVDRYFAVSIPHRYNESMFAKHYTKIMLASLLGYLCMYAAIAAVFWDRGYSVKGVAWCQLGAKRAPSLGMISFAAGLLTMVAIIVIYTMLVRKTFKLGASKMHLSAGDIRYIRQLVITVGALLFFKVIFWSPILVTIALRSAKRSGLISERTGIIATALYPVISPILYGATSERYRAYLKARLTGQSAINYSTNLSIPTKLRSTTEPSDSITASTEEKEISASSTASMRTISTITASDSQL